MARPRLADSVRVPVGLEVSAADAARIDEVLMRPEFDGWSRAEWCREIIRTALRYYVGGDPGQRPVQPPVSESPAPTRAPAPGVTAPAPVPPPAAPVPPPQPKCPHPADAWDYDTGTCAACGASVGD